VRKSQKRYTERVKPKSNADDWIRLEKYIEDSLNTGVRLYSVADIYRAISKGEMQFWSGKNCVIITSILIYPQCKILDIVVGGGDLKELLKFKKIITAYAKQNKCKYLSTGGRRGWQRILNNDKQIVTVFKEI